MADRYLIDSPEHLRRLMKICCGGHGTLSSTLKVWSVADRIGGSDWDRTVFIRFLPNIAVAEVVRISLLDGRRVSLGALKYDEALEYAQMYLKFAGR